MKHKEKSRNRPNKYDQLNFNKVSKAAQSRKNRFSVNRSEQRNTMCGKKRKRRKSNLYTPHTILKINLNRLKYIDLNVKHKTETLRRKIFMT